MKAFENPRQQKLYRRSWRNGHLPGTGTTPPVLSPLADEGEERLVPAAEPVVRPVDEWDTGQLAAIYPDAAVKAQAYLDGGR